MSEIEPKGPEARKQLVQWLIENKIAHWFPSEHQIKVGPFNFYPATGKITVDGMQRIGNRGMAAFKELVHPDGNKIPFTLAPVITEKTKEFLVAAPKSGWCSSKVATDAAPGRRRF